MATKAAAGAITLRGEFVLVLEAAPGGASSSAEEGGTAVSMSDGRAEVARLVAAGARRSDAARSVASATGLDRHELYRPD
jgi:16S rRNA C1402 (ribose-2'-O) methylase RsmI